MKRYAVVTPYFSEAVELLERCVASVKSQTVRTEHIVVSDGEPQAWLDTAGVRHIRLDRNHDDYGNTPRVVGALLAIGSGYDAVTFLDADNWLDPVHVEHCLWCAHTIQPAADVILAKRRFIRQDGSIMPLIEDRAFIDTNCFFLMRPAFYALPIWGLMPRELAPICDRIFSWAIQAEVRKRSLRATDSHRITVNYRSLWQSGYLALGETPPADARPNIEIGPIRDWWQGLDKTRKLHCNRLIGFRLEQFLDLSR